MANPIGKVEIAWDSDFSTPEGSRTWTDVSDRAEGDSEIGGPYGRSDELSSVAPAAWSVTLDNRDGRFTPGNASSPYYPNVKIGKPIRVTTTYNGVPYVRFTGYIDEWPIVWPDGSSAACTVTVTATSRRARLGNTAPLPSAIRTAYTETNPKYVWPMDEDTSVVTYAGRQAFVSLNRNPLEPEADGILVSVGASPYKLIVRDGSPGPTDEESLVQFPPYPVLNAYKRYAGSGQIIVRPKNNGMTLEALARVDMDFSDSSAQFDILRLYTPDNLDFLVMNIIPVYGAILATIQQDSDTGAVLGGVTLHGAAGAPEVVGDGLIHHFATTIANDGTSKFYVDGQLLATDVGSPFKRTMPFFTVGANSVACTGWAGWVAIHEEVLSDSQILSRANRATTANEDIDERVKRLAGYLAVPAAEIDVEATIAPPLGPQAEKGRSASEVLDEIASSTGGVLYDDQDGHLVLQSRNHRYNQSAAFTLDGALQEVGADITPVLDTRYLTNDVTVTRVGSDSSVRAVDQPSVNAYGVYAQTPQIVSSSDYEAESNALNLIAKYADPQPRISAVTVDLANLGTSQRAALLTADIGTKFAVSNLPGQAPATTMAVFLEGYTESITSTSHTLTINTTPAYLDTLAYPSSTTFPSSTTLPNY